MADAIDDLEGRIFAHLPSEILPTLYTAIDEWRHEHAGNRTYIARRSHTRQERTISRLADEHYSLSEIAARVGLSTRQVRRIRSKQSSYI